MDLRDKYGVNKNLYKEVICPVCRQVTLDSFWICDNCNWEYDEEKGCPEENIPAGTKFEDLPDDFECPLCHVGKDMFEEA